MTYQVEIVETLSRTVEVKAANAKDAERRVLDKYRAGDIVLGGDDCVEHSIRAIPDQPSE